VHVWPSRRRRKGGLRVQPCELRARTRAGGDGATRWQYGITYADVTFKVTDEEARLIRSGARKERVTVSEYLRRRASLSLAPARKPAKVRCPHTGAMIFAWPDNQPRLTTSAVRALLSDSP
jgi:hypothetical protein